MLSRRVLITRGVTALVGLGGVPAFLARAAAAGTGRRKVLVTVFLRGAIDGLNVVVPFAEPDYYFSRPSIAIPRPGAEPDAALDLDMFFGLHPRLSRLLPLYRQGALAVVHGCGSPHGTRSHFDAQDYLESGTPGVKSTADGWLNRYLAASATADATPFRGVAVTQQRPRALYGAAPTLTMSDLNRFGLSPERNTAAFRESLADRYRITGDDTLGQAGRDAFEALRLLESVRVDAAPDHGATYPPGAFGRSLRQIASLIKADVGLQIGFAELGGWDHHADEGATTGRLARGLDELAAGLTALWTDLGDRMEDVVILTMSEFGRSVEENGSRGTDHGHGNVMLLLGGNLNGGRVHGRWPGLSPEQRFERRDLAVTTDFRDLFGEILVRHLGVPLADARPIFPGHPVEPARFPGVLPG